MRIALLEDDKQQAEVMQVWLEATGHVCHCFRDSKSFQQAVGREPYELLILDWILPDGSGLEVLKWVRTHVEWPVPIIFVTQRDGEEDVVGALEAGADDYMVKPVKPLEMLARITALGRRSHPAREHHDILEFGRFRVDLLRRRLEKDGEPLELTHKEFDLALFLFRNTGRLLSREYLLECVWGTTADLHTRTVDTHISRIRNKLGLVPDQGWKLSAVYQHGYRLERVGGDEAADKKPRRRRSPRRGKKIGDDD